MIATGRQIRAARALLGWTRADLARAASVHVNSVAYWEDAANIPTGAYQVPVACRRMRKALLKSGVRTFVSPRIGVELCENDNLDSSARGRARPRHGVKEYCRVPELPIDKTRPVPSVKSTGPQLCGARTRQGRPCLRKALANRKCRNHGGASTGPRTQAGRDRIAKAQRKRWRQWRMAMSRSVAASDK